MTHGTGFGNGLTWVADFEGSEAEWERPLKRDVYKTPETSGGGVIGRGPGPNRGRPRGMLRSSRDPQSGSSRDRGRTRQDQQWHRGLRGCGMLGNRQYFPSSRARRTLPGQTDLHLRDRQSGERLLHAVHTVVASHAIDKNHHTFHPSLPEKSKNLPRIIAETHINHKNTKNSHFLPPRSAYHGKKTPSNHQPYMTKIAIRIGACIAALPPATIKPSPHR